MNDLPPVCMAREEILGPEGAESSFDTPFEPYDGTPASADLRLVHTAPDGPSYELRAWASGLIVFDGKRNVRLGRWSRTMAPSKIEKLEQRLCQSKVRASAQPTPGPDEPFELAVERCGLHMRFPEGDGSAGSRRSAADDVLDTLGARTFARFAVY